MFTRERTVYAFLLGYAKTLVDDLPDERLADQPAAGLNHPAWVLGHLALAANNGLKVLGQPGFCSDDWAGLFGAGTVPSPERGIYPSKPALWAAFETGHAKFSAAAEAADPARLDAPNPIERARPRLPTAGDLVTHLLTAHEATHLGQLSAWRRVCGFRSVTG